MKYTVPSTMYHKLMNLLSLSVIAGLFIFIVLNLNSIPDKIPVHFDALGEIDRWTNKSKIWTLPIVSLIMFIGISIVEAFPRAWNIGVEITEKNRDAVYGELKNMIVTLKLVVVCTFAFLAVYQMLAKPLPSWFLFVELALIFGTIIFFIVRTIKKSKVTDDNS